MNKATTPLRTPTALITAEQQDGLLTKGDFTGT